MEILLPEVQVLNMTVPQGTSFLATITVREPTVNGVAGDPIDLMGYSFEGVAKLKYGAAESFSFTFTKQNQVSFPGKVDVELLTSATSALDLKGKTVKFVYDWKIIDPSARGFQIFKGVVTVTPSSSP